MSTLDRFVKFSTKCGKALMAFSGTGLAGSVLMPALGIGGTRKEMLPVTILSVLIFFIAFALTERLTRFAASRNQRLSKALEDGDVLAEQGKYAEAAEFYTRLAKKELKNNEWYFAFHSRNAFQTLFLLSSEPRIQISL